MSILLLQDAVTSTAAPQHQEQQQQAIMLQIVVNEPELKAQLDQMKAHEHQVQQQYNKAKRCVCRHVLL